MSCEIKAFANIVDPLVIKEFLFSDTTKKHDSCHPDELPLQQCCISLSSTGDVLALASNSKIVILSSKWDSQEEGDAKNKFYVTWSGEITRQQNEWVTCIACLPLISSGKAHYGNAADWTCVAIGLNNGYLNLYTETGALLLSEQLHDEPILGIKCQSLTPPRYSGDVGLSEEIHVIYNSNICILQGFPFFSTLRARRNQLARARAKCNDGTPVSSSISYKKWGFRNQDVTNDSEVIGSTTVNTFDHLATASICGGYNASYRSSAPQHNLVMVTGKRPFIGFHYALEGSTAPVLSDVAIAVASKLANAIGSAVPWFRSNSKLPATTSSSSTSSPEKTKLTVPEPAESMMCRFGLSDLMREGDSIIVSPNKMLSVVTDAMGRVILVDNKRGIATRMWKGYRDAQCGWIEVTEDRVRSSSSTTSSKSTHKFSNKHSHRLRKALFLIIYAPKKGVIDIWGIQQGAKITTFTASKNGRLLYTNYGLLGLSDPTPLHVNRAQYPCVFFDPLGGLKEITVPFHFALNSSNGKRARDVHLMKKLKSFIREEEFNEEKLINEITNVCIELKTNHVRLQVVEMLMSCSDVTPDALLAALNCFIDKLEKYEEKEEIDPTAKQLYLITRQVKRIVEFYKRIREQFDCPPEYNTIASDTVPDCKYLSAILLTSEREIHRVLKLSKTVTELEEEGISNTRKRQVKVKFQEDGKTFLDFLSSFEFGNTITSNNCNSSTSQGFVGLHRNLSLDKKCQIAQLIYQGWMYSNDSISTWRESAALSSIQPSLLMQLLLIYWNHRKPIAPLEIELSRFTELVQTVCQFADVEEISADYNDMSTWWKEVRYTLTESVNPLHALTAALSCRAAVATLEICKEKMVAKEEEPLQDKNGNSEVMEKRDPAVEKMETAQDESNDEEEHDDGVSSEAKNEKRPGRETPNFSNDWVNVSKDTCQFSLLIGNLEDVTVLNAVVGEKPPCDETTNFFTLPFEKPDVSLGIVLSRGKGSVSEIVARWLTSAGVNPAKLVDTTDVEFVQMQLESIDYMQLTDPMDEGQQKQQQDDRREEESRPIDVEIGSEVKADLTAEKLLLEKLTLLKRHFPYSLTSSVLLANLCWEFVVAWNKDVTRLKALESALAVLKQIPMKHMRQGVCCLLWNLHIKTRMATAANLMNKRGKLPNEHFCMQDVGLSDIQLTEFLQHCVTFLDIFLDAEVIEAEKSTIVKSEELWEGHFAPGPQPFAALAVSQTPAWYDLVMLHLQLANVLHMMAHFNFKLMRPMNNLFDSVALSHFFQDITKKSELPWYRDHKRDSCRQDFLCRVITSSMESIHQEGNEISGLSSVQAVLWMSRCQTLASIWKINNDELRIHQVCQLYINGFDRLADEVVTAVNDTERLAVDLLPIAGRRMMAYLSKTPDLLEEVSRINPALTKYLETLNSSSTVLTNCSNEDTIDLVHRICRHISPTHADYHLAQLMLDATFIYQGKT